VPKHRRSHQTRRRILLAIAAVPVVLILAFVVTALIPMAQPSTPNPPDPAPDYGAAVARFDAITAEEKRLGIFEPCRSRLLTHGAEAEIAVVLFHGLTNCPKQWVEFAEEVHAQGANVLILRAPHHGLANADGTAIGSATNLAVLTPEELESYAQESVDIGAGLGRQQRVAGLSMGGVIAAWIAQNAENVERSVVISPALTLPVGGCATTNAAIRIFGRLPSILLPGSDKSSIDHAYSRETTHGLVALYRLGAIVIDQSESTPPAVRRIAVDWNANDNQIDNSKAQDLADSWRSNGADVTTHVFPKSLGMPHDVIDPAQPTGDVKAVYPVLLEQLGFEQAP
jgi:esterase/lipase